MTEAVPDFVSRPVEERLQGGRPGRFRAVLAAIAIGGAACLLAYRLMRSGDEEPNP